MSSWWNGLYHDVFIVVEMKFLIFMQMNFLLTSNSFHDVGDSRRKGFWRERELNSEEMAFAFFG